MAVTRNESLDELRAWFLDERRKLQAEYFLEVFDAKHIGRLLYELEPVEGSVPLPTMEQYFLEIWKGIPVITCHEASSRNNPDSTMRDGKLLYVLGLPPSSIEKLGLEPFPEEMEKTLLSYFQKNVTFIERSLLSSVNEFVDVSLHSLGSDPEQLIADAITKDIILDESTVTPSFMYCMARTYDYGFPKASIKMQDDAINGIRAFLGEQLEDGLLSRKDFDLQMAFVRKSVSDLFHPWTLLKGKMDHRLYTIGDICEGIEAKDIAQVAHWASTEVEYKPYMAQIGDWISQKAKKFRFTRKSIDDVLKQFGHTEGFRQQSRPALPKGIVQKARKKYNSPSPM